MYKRLKLKFSNTHLLSLSANVIVVILGILSYVLLCRILTLRERGVWLFFQSLFALADSIRSGFLSTGFIKFYAGVEKKRATEVAGSTWIISIAITLIFCMVSGASYFTTDFIEDEGISYFLKWLGVLAIVSLPHFMAICLVQAKEHFGKFLVLKLFRNFIFIACFVTFYFYNRHTAIEIIYSYLISFTISSLLTLILGWCDVKTVLSYNKKVIKELLDFGKYSMGTNLSATLFQTVENFVINFMLGPAALAICDVGAKMLEFVEIPLRSFSVSGMPILAAAHNKGDKDKVIKTAKQLIGIFTVLMIPCVIIAIIFAEPIIGLIGGGKYINTEAVNLFRLFITISLLYPADRFLSLTLDAVNMPKVNFIKALIMLAVLTVSCFLGVYLTGNIYGIAYASVFPLITSIYISYLYINSYQIFSFSGTYKFGYHDLKYRFNELLRLKNNASENDI